LFEWLKVQNVESILDLNIPDNPAQPMSEDFVFEYIFKHFVITKLDWRKLDIDLSALRGVGAVVKGEPETTGSIHQQRAELTKHLQTLKLYSSGNY